jgi:hypothetical protein
MAVTIRIYNNATQLASKTIPDGAVARIQTAFPAATAALSAEAFLDALAPEAQRLVWLILANALSTSLATTGAAAHKTLEDEYRIDWP